MTSGLRRIEGQIRGIQRMLDEQRDCIDVLVQMNAVRAVLLHLEAAMLRDHVNTCVSEAFSAGNVDDQRARPGELVDAIWS